MDACSLQEYKLFLAVIAEKVAEQCSLPHPTYIGTRCDSLHTTSFYFLISFFDHKPCFAFQVHHILGVVQDSRSDKVLRRTVGKRVRESRRRSERRAVVLSSAVGVLAVALGPTLWSNIHRALRV